MERRRSYGQFCALARALDHVGERWTLLIVRELLAGPRSFRQLQEALDGISPTLLVERMRALVGDGLVERNDAPARSKAVAYRLSEAGAGLEPAMLELIRWGARWMATGPGQDRVEPAWAALALRALLDGTRTVGPGRGIVHVDVGGTWVTIRSGAHRRAVHAGRHGAPSAVVTAGLPELLAVASGLRSARDLAGRISGDAALARGALAAPP